MSVRSAVTWPVRQSVGFFVNVYQALASVELDDVAPPWVRATLSWLRSQVPRAIGYGTPQQQIIASIVLAIAMIVSSLGLLTWLALIMLVPATIGFWRFVPVVNDYWPLNDGGQA